MAVFKFNGGRGALLCNDCGKILKTDVDFTDEERLAYFKDPENVFVVGMPIGILYLQV